MFDYMHTSDHQFGFKRGHSTLMPVMLLKELLRFYNNHGNNMHVCYLDASKAFDRVDYSVLFRKLVNRGIPGYIVRLLWNWYSSHQASVQWAHVLTNSFSIIVMASAKAGFCLRFYLRCILMICQYGFNQYTRWLSIE